MAVVEGTSAPGYDNDLWVAVVAGEQAWVDSSTRATPPARATAIAELVALGACVTTLWLIAWARTPAPDGFGRAAPVLGSVAAAALASRPLRLLTDRRVEASVWRSIGWRSVAALVLVGTLLANDPMWGILVLSPFGVAAGAEAALAAWQVGLDVNPWRWWLRFLRSGAHAGLLGALVAHSIWFGADGLPTALHLYLLAHFVFVVGSATAAILDGEQRHHVAESARAARALATAEHRRTAHWLHDDVTAQLRIVGLRLQSGDLSAAEVVGSLADLEQHLRVRQLDVILESGSASLAEILQPYVRDAQRHGLTIVEVPTFDDASLAVDAEVGRRFARAAAIATANAIQAGATSLGYAVRHDQALITLEVRDDAPMFDLSDVPAGRALWELRQELGPRSISITSAGSGKVIGIAVPRHGGVRHGAATAR